MFHLLIVLAHNFSLSFIKFVIRSVLVGSSVMATSLSLSTLVVSPVEALLGALGSPRGQGLGVLLLALYCRRKAIDFFEMPISHVKIKVDK